MSIIYLHLVSGITRLGLKFYDLVIVLEI